MLYLYEVGIIEISEGNQYRPESFLNKESIHLTGRNGSFQRGQRSGVAVFSGVDFRKPTNEPLHVLRGSQVARPPRRTSSLVKQLVDDDDNDDDDDVDDGGGCTNGSIGKRF